MRGTVSSVFVWFDVLKLFTAVLILFRSTPLAIANNRATVQMSQLQSECHPEAPDESEIGRFCVGTKRIALFCIVLIKRTIIMISKIVGYVDMLVGSPVVTKFDR